MSSSAKKLSGESLEALAEDFVTAHMAEKQAEERKKALAPVLLPLLKKEPDKKYRHVLHLLQVVKGGGNDHIDLNAAKAALGEKLAPFIKPSKRYEYIRCDFKGEKFEE